MYIYIYKNIYIYIFIYLFIALQAFFRIRKRMAASTDSRVKIINEVRTVKKKHPLFNACTVSAPFFNKARTVSARPYHNGAKYS